MPNTWPEKIPNRKMEHYFFRSPYRNIVWGALLKMQKNVNRQMEHYFFHLPPQEYCLERTGKNAEKYKAGRWNIIFFFISPTGILSSAHWYKASTIFFFVSPRGI
jgi:hypothetical protein